MDDPQRAVRTLNAIRSLGVHFTIDDFGTGYSSLTHLKRLPVACIKIDKSFVLNMQTDKDDAVIVRSIIDLGRNLGLKVIAEGVETAQAREMLAEFGCDEAQGYYFSYPLLPGEITHLLYKSASVVEPEGASASSADIAVHLEHVPQLAHLPNSTLFHCK
jgi:EAL domain-containing protein (putative c-di-GMP-specific phosphodiesterase class I)